MSLIPSLGSIVGAAGTQVLSQGMSAVNTVVSNKLSRLGVLRQAKNFLVPNMYNYLLQQEIGAVFKINAEMPAGVQSPTGQHAFSMVGLLEQEISFNFTATYGLMAEAEIARKFTDGAIDKGTDAVALKSAAVGGALASVLKEKLTVNKSYTKRRWENTSIDNNYIVIPLTFSLLAFTNAQGEVIDNLAGLADLILPQELSSSTSYNVESRTLGDSLLIGPYGSKEGPRITLDVGTYLSIPNLVVTGLNINVARETMIDGFPAYANVSLTLEGVRAVSAQEFKSYFQGGTGAGIFANYLKRFI